MDEAKRKRLEARGWRVGDVSEFLGLSREEAALIELKLNLADSLRERRLGRHWPQSQLARILKSSQSRVAKMEAADSSVSLDLMIRSLFVLGMSKRELAEAILQTPPAKAD